MLVSAFVFRAYSYELELGYNEIPPYHTRSKALYYYKGDIDNNDVYLCDLDERSCARITKEDATKGIEVARKVKKHYYVYQVPHWIKCDKFITIFNGVGHRVYYQEMDNLSKCLAFIGAKKLNYTFYATPYDSNPVYLYVENDYNKPEYLSEKIELSFQDEQFVMLYYNYMNAKRTLTTFGAKIIESKYYNVFKTPEVNDTGIYIYEAEDEFVCVYDGASSTFNNPPIIIEPGNKHYSIHYDALTIVNDRNDEYSVFVPNYENFQECSKSGFCKPLSSAISEHEVYVRQVKGSDPLEIEAFKNPLGKQGVFYTNIFDKDIIIEDTPDTNAFHPLHSFFTTVESDFEINPNGKSVKLWHQSLDSPITISQLTKLSNLKFVSLERQSSSDTIKVKITSKNDIKNLKGSISGTQTFANEKLFSVNLAKVIKLSKNERIVTDSEFYYFPVVNGFKDVYTNNTLTNLTSNSHHVESDNDNNVFLAVNMSAAEECDNVTVLYNPKEYIFHPSENKGKVICLFTVSGPKANPSDKIILDAKYSDGFSNSVDIQQKTDPNNESQLIILDVQSTAADNALLHITHVLESAKLENRFMEWSVNLSQFMFTCYHVPKEKLPLWLKAIAIASFSTSILVDIVVLSLALAYNITHRT